MRYRQLNKSKGKAKSAHTQKSKMRNYFPTSLWQAGVQAFQEEWGPIMHGGDLERKMTSLQILSPSSFFPHFMY